MNERRPVITGISAVCSLGCSPDRIVNRLLAGDTNFSPVPFPSDFFKARRVALVPDCELTDAIADHRALRYMSRETCLAVTACLRCVEDAAIRNAYPKDAIGLFAGTGCSGIQLDAIGRLLDHSVHPETGRFDPDAFGKTALYKLNPLTSFQILPNMPATMCAIMAEVKGKNLIFNPWEGNALTALYEASFEIRSGRSNIVLCGGSDCKTHSNAFITFSEYGLLADSRVVMSEGSGYLALEARQAAENRNQRIYCTLRHLHHQSRPGSEAGGGACSEAFYSEMIETALSQSGLASEAIDLVLCSNDLTPEADAMENRAIARFFTCPVIAPKTFIGNTYAAAGMLHVVIGARILKSGIRVGGKRVERIFITSFAPGSEKYCIILEKP